MKTFLFLIAAVSLPLSLQAEPSGETKSTERVAFSQSCFWTGEMKLGRIDGVVRTEAGFFQGHEVTLVDYDPKRISLEDLARRARQAGVADRIHLDIAKSSGGASIGGVAAGAALDHSYRPAPPSDQKKQLEGTQYERLQLTPEQATKVNAFARSNPAKAAEWLAPAQRADLAASR